MSKQFTDLAGIGEILRQVKEFVLALIRIILARKEPGLKCEAQRLKNEEQALKNRE
ncbi:MAG TPA: hypothetical protein VK582_20190 [Pyrinomonadaceae bacterium]|nr:hypothetical protein [Pyrinomonadaceae bacterium]